MQKHLHTFLLILITVSTASFTMEEQKPRRLFPNPMPTELTEQEKESRTLLLGILREKLSTKFANTHSITSHTEQKPVPDEENKQAQIIHTNNIKPQEIADLDAKKECAQLLQTQIELARKAKQEKEALKKAQAEETAQKVRAEQDMRKKQKAIAVPMPATIILESEKTKFISSKPLEDDSIDALIQDLENSFPSKTIAPTTIEQFTIEPSAVDITPKIQELQKQLSMVATLAEAFYLPQPFINENFTFELEHLDKLADLLTPYLKIKGAEEKIPALNRLKDFLSSTQESNDAIRKSNADIIRVTAYREYSASLKSLQSTLDLAK